MARAITKHPQLDRIKAQLIAKRNGSRISYQEIGNSVTPTVSKMAIYRYASTTFAEGLKLASTNLQSTECGKSTTVSVAKTPHLANRDPEEIVQVVSVAEDSLVREYVAQVAQYDEILDRSIRSAAADESNQQGVATIHRQIIASVETKAKLQGVGAVAQAQQHSGPTVTIIMPQLPARPGDRAEVVDAEVIERD